MSYERTREKKAENAHPSAHGPDIFQMRLSFSSAAKVPDGPRRRGQCPRSVCAVPAAPCTSHQQPRPLKSILDRARLRSPQPNTWQTHPNKHQSSRNEMIKDNDTGVTVRASRVAARAHEIGPTRIICSGRFRRRGTGWALRFRTMMVVHGFVSFAVELVKAAGWAPGSYVAEFRIMVVVLFNKTQSWW